MCLGSPAGLGPILSPGQRHCCRPGSTCSIKLTWVEEKEIQVQALSLPGSPKRPDFGLLHLTPPTLSWPQALHSELALHHGVLQSCLHPPHFPGPEKGQMAQLMCQVSLSVARLALAAKAGITVKVIVQKEVPVMGQFIGLLVNNVCRTKQSCLWGGHRPLILFQDARSLWVAQSGSPVVGSTAWHAANTL